MDFKNCLMKITFSKYNCQMKKKRKYINFYEICALVTLQKFWTSVV